MPSDHQQRSDGVAADPVADRRSTTSGAPTRALPGRRRSATSGDLFRDSVDRSAIRLGVAAQSTCAFMAIRASVVIVQRRPIEAGGRACRACRRVGSRSRAAPGRPRAADAGARCAGPFGSGRRSTMPRASSRSIRRATVIGSTSSSSASSFCDRPGWRSSQIRMAHCARVMPCGAGALVGLHAEQPGDVVQQERAGRAGNLSRPRSAFLELALTITRVMISRIGFRLCTGCRTDPCRTNISRAAIAAGVEP